MRQVVALLFSLSVVAAYSVTQAEDNTNVSLRPSTGDAFLDLIKEIEASSFFPGMSFETRVLTFEMLTAAETNHLKALLDRTGYIKLFEYIAVLPLDYQRQFITFSVEHLKNEITDMDQYDVV